MTRDNPYNEPFRHGTSPTVPDMRSRGPRGAQCSRVSRSGDQDESLVLRDRQKSETGTAREREARKNPRTRGELLNEEGAEADVARRTEGDCWVRG